MNDTNKHLVEIWSDIMCPFCYIGKRKFESALAESAYKNEVEIIWKSYQLSPDLTTDPTKTVHEYLATHKNIPVTQAKQMGDQVANLALQEGLHYDFDKAIPANSFQAHQLSHFALEKGLQNILEEKLFSAYFTEGKNIDDTEILIEIAKEIGLNETETRAALKENKYAAEVEKDIMEAQQIGVRGVPFFVFDRKYAISGAQPKEAFLETLNAAFDNQ